MTVELVFLAVVTLTSYQPIPAQTDDSPTWTANGDRTTKYGIAVSQDLLNEKGLHYGDIVYVEHFGYRVVNDCMNKRHTKSADLLVFTHAEEKRIGTRHLKLWKVRGPNEL